MNTSSSPAGINLVDLVGEQIQIGDAVLFLYEASKPCDQMNAVCAWLRELMEGDRQGVMAEVVRSGRVRVGDSISLYR